MTAPVGEVTTPMTRGRKGSRRLRCGSNRPSAASALRRRSQQRQQRALAGQLQPLDDDLVFGAPRIGGELAGRDDLGAVLGPERQRAGAGPPDHRVHAGGLVLQAEIAMARRMALEPGNLAADADLAEGALDRPLERARQFADAERRRIVAGSDVR